MKILNSIKKGIIKGYKIQVLPDNISKFYSNIYIRILRVIGGLSAVLVLSKNYLLLPSFLQYLVLALGLVQFIQMTVISLIKTIYIINKLINNPEEFEVRNSPLDRYGTHVVKLLSCWRAACNTVGTGTGFIGTGFLIDQVLEAGGQEKVFTPYFGKAIKAIAGDKNLKAKENINFITNHMQKIQSKEEEINFVKNEIANKCDEDVLVSQGLTPAEAKELRSGVLAMVEATQEEKAKFVKEVMDKVKESEKK